MVAEVVRARLVAYARDAALDARNGHPQAGEEPGRAPLPARRRNARVGDILELRGRRLLEERHEPAHLGRKRLGRVAADYHELAVEGVVEMVVHVRSSGSSSITITDDLPSKSCTVTAARRGEVLSPVIHGRASAKRYAPLFSLSSPSSG